MNGWVYAAFASHCDNTPYAGYVSGVDVEQRPLKATLWTDEAGVSDDQAGIWQSGGGLMSDGPSGSSSPPATASPRPRAPGTSPRASSRSPWSGCSAQADGSAPGAGLLQPGERAQARRGRPRLRRRRPGRAPVRHDHLPGRRRPGGQVRTAVPAQPRQPRRPPAELRRRGRGPLRDRPPQGPVGPPRGLRRHDDTDRRECRQLQRLPLLRRPERLHARVQGRCQRQR